ncbi:adenosylcobinamide-GDP ribazoletransferase [Teichococcus oryzae]|uniref:Adenosylcobinamide-GDP ribazoletransferase n=1 Tax=Teichococcus oryzae TaxID=1608942 RepID=A0A5B2TBA0_9PROT|nr:adenosylcobinamide-GDP ribazoletransferase [Pseudoroseomonas oryzae]KAA2211797.1 adenosylcobinamide-GDP ribazoletransferase [Pseudoroseomonas oryzae]
MIRARLAEIGAAFGLLTRLPVGWLPVPEAANGYARAAWAWPLAGAALGALAGAVQAGLVAAGLPPSLAAPWAIAVLLLASGGLHEDGLADTADGFGGGGGRERKLAIMRDSRIGSFGTLALILCLGLRGTALALLAAPLPAMAAAGALARLAMLPPLLFLPPARRDGLAAGLGRPGPVPAIAALAVATGLALLLLPVQVAWPALLAASGAAVALSWLAWRQIGGQTGDVLGATAMVAECAVLTALIASG